MKPVTFSTSAPFVHVCVECYAICIGDLRDGSDIKVETVSLDSFDLGWFVFSWTVEDVVHDERVSFALKFRDARVVEFNGPVDVAQILAHALEPRGFKMRQFGGGVNQDGAGGAGTKLGPREEDPKHGTLLGGGGSPEFQEQ